MKHNKDIKNPNQHMWLCCWFKIIHIACMWLERRSQYQSVVWHWSRMNRRGHILFNVPNVPNNNKFSIRNNSSPSITPHQTYRRSKKKHCNWWHSFLGSHEGSNTPYSVNKKNDDLCVPAVETLSPINNTPMFKLLSPNANVPLDELCK